MHLCNVRNKWQEYAIIFRFAVHSQHTVVVKMQHTIKKLNIQYQSVFHCLFLISSLFGTSVRFCIMTMTLFLGYKKMHSTLESFFEGLELFECYCFNPSVN